MSCKDFRYTGFDPLEGTANNLASGRAAEHIGCTGFDPLEGTARFSPQAILVFASFERRVNSGFYLVYKEGTNG
jgi:hypothetical protein